MSRIAIKITRVRLTFVAQAGKLLAHDCGQRVNSCLTPPGPFGIVPGSGSRGILPAILKPWALAPMLLLVVLIFLFEGRTMRKNLLIAVLVLMTVWATGCIVINAEHVEPCGPATMGSGDLTICESHAIGVPVCESSPGTTPDTLSE